MTAALAVGAIGLALALISAWWLRRRPPEPTGADIEDPDTEPRPTVRILRNEHELREAVERAAASERALASQASQRAARYTRFTGEHAAPLT